MRIIEDIKLDFDDVLIKPKRSFLVSRKDVDLIREFVFPHSTRTLECTPIVAANMDTTGSFSMAKTLAKNYCITCLHKHYDAKEYVDFYSNSDYITKSVTFYSLGISRSDFEKLCWVSEQITKNARLEEWQENSLVHDQAPNICVDVANGYTEQFVKQLSKIRKAFPRSIIMAGNVVTPEMTEELILHGGVDIVKVGIGSGCFVAGTKVTTINKKKKIEDIKVGDVVLTHKGRYKKVIGTKARKEKETIVDINGIKCTTNHEFYVVHKSHKHLVNENNLEQYAKWVSAEGLSDDYFLVKIQE